MDVELEQVEERVADEVDGAVDLTFRAVVEFERSTGFVADGKGDPLDLMFLVFDMFARFTTTNPVSIFSMSSVSWENLRAAIHALYMDGSAIVI